MQFENKIPNVSSLVKKTNYDAKTSDMESKYITTADYNKFNKDVVDNSIKSKNLVDKLFQDSQTMLNYIKKVTTLATKAELKEQQDKISKLQAFKLFSR